MNIRVPLKLQFAQPKPDAEAKPADAKPADTKPADAGDAKAGDVKAGDAKAGDGKEAVKGEKPAEGEAGVEVPAKPAAQGTGDFLQMFAPFLIIAVVFYLLILRPQRKDQSSREEMLKQLKKNDRVLTIGGIIGTVSNISDDGKEVTIKIDDDAKMHVIRSAIQTVLVDKVKEPPKA